MCSSSLLFCWFRTKLPFINSLLVFFSQVSAQDQLYSCFHLNSVLMMALSVSSCLPEQLYWFQKQSFICPVWLQQLCQHSSVSGWQWLGQLCQPGSLTACRAAASTGGARAAGGPGRLAGTLLCLSYHATMVNRVVLPVRSWLSWWVWCMHFCTGATIADWNLTHGWELALGVGTDPGVAKCWRNNASASNNISNDNFHFVIGA